MPAHALTRKELYDRVWSTPVKKLAPTLGLSDVGLSKICRRFNIPVPPRGYWAQLAFGKAVERASLPDPSSNPRIGWSASEPPTVSPPSRWQTLLNEMKAVPPVVVAGGPLQHPLVKETGRHLAKGFPRAEAPRGALRIKVSASLRPRALAIMDALLLACESVGWRVETDRRDHYVRPIARGGVWSEEKPDARNVSTRIVLKGEPIEIGMCERFERRPPTAAEIRKHKRSYPYGVLTSITAPTGKLTLGVLSHSGVGHRKVTDTATKKVEDQLNRFMVMLVQAVISNRRNRVEWKRREREERHVARRRAAVEELRRAHLRRVRLLERETRAWRRHRTEAAFLRALRRTSVVVPLNPAFLEWLAWAERYVGERSEAAIAATISKSLAGGSAAGAG